MSHYVPVQHSGYGYSNKPGFKQGLEPRSVNLIEARHVHKAGGLVFDSYQACDDYCDRENYPPGVTGMYPQARGTFSTVKIDGLAVYLPAGTVVL